MLIDEKQLLSACLDGDEQAQRRFYERFAPKMYAVCLRYAPDNGTAEDYLQESFIRIFAQLKSYRGDGSLEGWIRRVVVNTCLTFLRKTDIIKHSIEIDHITQYSDDDANISDKIHAAELLDHIRALPPGFRTVFNLYAIEGYSHKEIGVLLRISEGTSKSQYARARLWLQQRLIKQSPDHDTGR
jgi:RNA polymerase sigma factor (sigma-70 family)